MPSRILVVDDHAPTRSMIRSMIEADRSAKHEVVEASSGEGALLAVEKGPPFDLILLDVEMPGISGFDACRKLREHGLKTPIVFVTGRGDLKDFNAGREAGGDSYLKKPIARAALRSIVGLFTSGSVSRE
jgi:two-component system OmpR family response regulator